MRQQKENPIVNLEEIQMSHQQLTLHKRYQIWALLAAGLLQKHIAAWVGVNPSTISRELRRHSYKGYYCPDQAQAFADAKRRFLRRPYKIKNEIKDAIIRLLKLKYSPYDIACILTGFAGFPISPQGIYNYIEQDRKDGGKLFQLLPFEGRARRSDLNYRPAQYREDSKHNINNRPKAANNRTRFGDVEIDTLVSKDRKGGVVAIVDRKTRYMWAEIVDDLTAKTVTNAILKALIPHKESIKSITTDNGSEFALKDELMKELGCKYFYAHPYSPWQRGTVERMIRDIRRRYPKRTDFRKVGEKEFRMHIDLINHKPRACLKYKSPHNAVFKKGEFWNTQTALHLILDNSFAP